MCNVYFGCCHLICVSVILHLWHIGRRSSSIQLIGLLFFRRRFLLVHIYYLVKGFFSFLIVMFSALRKIFVILCQCSFLPRLPVKCGFAGLWICTVGEIGGGVQSRLELCPLQCVHFDSLFEPQICSLYFTREHFRFVCLLFAEKVSWKLT